ncbi:hypothetical protein LOK49_LG02G02390 [Camellia lanceoleosa]|uniref:Uncharacterized protein n=1 Tax=Camellia lanceoleosa TaxID=1840588 RepID=A0ACC0IIZ9_9ERIC|nr:hypothetical protein LOK49_LG02G02390 [Camellia lanceoleosa]
MQCHQQAAGVNVACLAKCATGLVTKIDEESMAVLCSHMLQTLSLPELSSEYFFLESDAIVSGEYLELEKVLLIFATFLPFLLYMMKFDQNRAEVPEVQDEAQELL